MSDVVAKQLIIAATNVFVVSGIVYALARFRRTFRERNEELRKQRALLNAVIDLMMILYPNHQGPEEDYETRRKQAIHIVKRARESEEREPAR